MFNKSKFYNDNVSSTLSWPLEVSLYVLWVFDIERWRTTYTVKRLVIIQFETQALITWCWNSFEILSPNQGVNAHTLSFYLTHFVICWHRSAACMRRTYSAIFKTAFYGPSYTLRSFSLSLTAYITPVCVKFKRESIENWINLVLLKKNVNLNLNQFTLKIREYEFLIDSNTVNWIDSAFF